jgi:ERCC4-type nuclease
MVATEKIKEVPKAPFVVVVDSREQAPYRFTEIERDRFDGGGILMIPLQTGRALPSGDYSIVGYESRMAVERKSLVDLFGSVGRERKRFEAEIERLNEFEFAAVVVEDEIGNMILHPPPQSQLSPKTITRTIQSWSIRYPMVHWFFLPGRRAAEVWTFRLLEMYWRQQQKISKDEITE